MSLQIIETYEYEENGNTYVYTKYQRDDGGITEERIVKPEPVKLPTNGVQRGHTELNGVSVVIPLELIDVSKATVQLDVQGCDAPYAYTLAEDALTVTFAEPVQAWINWEVRG